MNKVVVLFYLTIIGSTLAQYDQDDTESLQASQIIPNKLVQVKYPSGAIVNSGNKLTPFEVKDIPTVTWDADKKSYYTLFMIDLDAPSRKNPIYREFRHWFVVNIPGDNVRGGDTLFAYYPPTPPKGSGFHRYVFLVYKQNGILNTGSTFVPKNSAAGRAPTSTAETASKYDLGYPVAGNYFEAQFDE